MSNGPFPPKLQADYQATLKKFFAADDQRPPVIFVDGQMGDEIKKKYSRLDTFVKEFWQYTKAHPEIVYVEYADAPSLINKDTSVCYFNQANERGLLSYAFGDDESICQAKSRITVGFGSTTPWTVEPGKFVRHEMTLSGRHVYFTIKRADVPRALDLFREEFFKPQYQKCGRAEQHDEFIVDPQLLVDRGIDVATVITMPGDVICMEEGTMWCSVAAGLMEKIVVYWPALYFHHYALKLGKPDPFLCICGKAKSQRLFVESNIERVKLAWYMPCRDQKIAFTDDPESSCFPCNFYPERQASKKYRKDAMANHVKKDATRDICMTDPIGYFEGDLRQALKRASFVRMTKAAEKADKAAEKAAETKPATPKTIGGLGRFSRQPSKHSEGDAGSMVSEQLTPTGTSGRSSAAVADHPESDQSDADEGQEEKPEKEKDEKQKKEPANKGSGTAAAKEPISAELVDLANDSSDCDKDVPTKKPSPASAGKQASAKPSAVDTASSSKSSAPGEGTVEALFAEHRHRANALKEQEKKAQKAAAAAAAVLAGPPPPRAAASVAVTSFKATQPAPSVPLKRGEFPARGGKAPMIKTEPIEPSAASTPKATGREGPQKVSGGRGGRTKGRAQKANLKGSAANKQKVVDDSGEDSEPDEEIEDEDEFDGFTQEDIDESEGGGHDLRHRKRDDDDDGKGGGAAGVSGSAAKRQRKSRSELERLSNY